LLIDKTSLETLNETVSMVILCKVPAGRLLKVTLSIVDKTVTLSSFTDILKESYWLLFGGCHDTSIDDVLIGIAEYISTRKGAARRRN